MGWWLQILPPDGAESAAVLLPLGASPLTVGKGSDCDLVLPGARVSRRHCVFALTPAGPTVRDLGSSLGTLVNGRKNPRCTLVAGDTVTVDRVRVRIRDSLPDIDGPSPSVTGPAGGDPGPPDDGKTAAGSDPPVDWTPFHAFLARLRAAGDSRLLLERLLEGLVGFARAERGFVLLADAKGKDLVAVASHEIDAPGERERISGTVCRAAIDAGRILVIDDSAHHALCAEAPSLAVSAAPRSIVCAPLMAEGRAVGVIYVDRLLATGVWSADRIAFFESVTSLAAELIAARRTRRHLVEARDRIEALSRLARDGGELVLGDGPRADALRRAVEAAAAQDVSVLVTGETGTGKEVVARALHALSDRRNGPFVAVHCAALPRDMLEAELFGAEKGSYTGATERRIGRFELAAGGTLFLDEVGDIPPDVQVKLLRVLQERRLQRLGGSDPIALDFRLVSATNAELEARIRDGGFRQDLYYRIDVFRIRLSPLRERPEDVLPLARHFLAEFSRSMSKNAEDFDEGAARLLVSHSWPGNVRELRNAVERAVVLSDGLLVTAADLPLGGSSVPASVPTKGLAVDDLPENYEEARALFDRAFLETLLARHDGNIRAVARATAMSRTTLYKKLQKSDLLPNDA